MCQFFLPGKKVHFEQADLHILQDYKAKYLHGVRQNSIRHNIKNKAGTLPPHGYGTSDSDPNPVDFGQLLSDNSSATEGTGSDVPVITLSYPDNSIVLIKTPDYCRPSGVVLAKLTSPV